MTDTLTLAPTDAEIEAAYRKVWSTIPHAQRLSAFAHEIASTLAARWGAPAPASREVVAEPEHSLCNDPRLCCRSHPHPDQSMHCQLREVAAWLRWHAATGKTPWPESMHTHAEQVDAAALALTAPPAQEARVPLTSEQQRCIAEAHSVAACEEYFSVRPQIDYSVNRRIFEAGFSKGYGITAAQKGTP